jgi:hypothetical protein
MEWRGVGMPLIIRPIMNSPVGEIFAFKTCCGVRVFDQNLEIQITNRSEGPVSVPSYFDLEDDSGLHRIETLFPQGELQVAPGETKAFYCAMDEIRWKRALRVVFYDKEGHTYPADI